MAFNKKKWAIDGSHANATLPRTHKYSTADSFSAVKGAGYFNAVSKEVSAGDLIDVVASTSTVAEIATLYVVSNAAGVVAVAEAALWTEEPA